jgi:protein-disulfide isomerase
LTSRRTAVLNTFALLFCFVGLFAAGTLSIGHLMNLPVPCGVSSGCAAVATHPSSRPFGIPLAYVGVAAFSILLCLNALSDPDGRIRRLTVALSGIGTLVSAGLLIYSRTVIGATCAWCLVSGASMAALFVVSLLSRPAVSPVPGMARLRMALTLLTAAGLGVQGGLMQRVSLAPPVPAAVLARVPPAELTRGRKALGPPDAPVTIVEFGDLACPACRAVHGSITAYQSAHPEAVRLVFRHRPLDQIRGHEHSALAAAIGEVCAEKGRFWDYAASVYELGGSANGRTLLDLAERFGLERARLKKRLADPKDPVLQRLNEDLNLAERLGIRSTPTFVVILTGQAPRSAGPRGLRRLLNSPGVVEAVAEAQRGSTGQK